MCASSNPQAQQTTVKYAETVKTCSEVLQRIVTMGTEPMEMDAVKIVQLNRCGLVKVGLPHPRTLALISVETEKQLIELATFETMEMTLMEMVVTRPVLQKLGGHVQVEILVVQTHVLTLVETVK